MKEVRWAFSFLGKHKIGMAFVWFLGIVFIGLEILCPVIIKDIVDNVLYPMFKDSSVSTDAVLEQLVPRLVFAMIITVSMCIIRFGANVLRDYVSQEAVYNMRSQLYDIIGEQSRKFFMRNRTGDLINKCTGDVECIRNFVAWISYCIFECIVMFVTILAVFSFINVKFTLALVSLAPITLVLSVIMGKKVKPIHRRSRDQLSKLNTVVSENIDGNRVVRAFCREQFELDKFDEENTKLYDYRLEANKVWVTYSPLIETVAHVMQTCSVVLGAIFVINGEITIGDLVIFTSLAWMLNNPMQQMGFLINDTQRFMTSCERVHELFKLKTDIVSPENAVTEPIHGKIEFKDVSMEYDGDKVLNNINLSIPVGATVGIMGATGSGKTTLINMIARFEDTTSGDIFIDDINVKDYELHHLRKNIAVALQDVFLLSDTVAANIAYGVPEADDRIIRGAAKDADADAFIEKLPDEYKTIIGERGMGLSGGQKQRLSLARALAMDAPILILDDTTSAVDLETEKYIQEHLAHRKKATTLIIAQRITAVKNADFIIVLENGKISEQGTHKELLAKKGYYYNIYRIQQGLAGGDI